MSRIKKIFDEIAAESGTNKKMEILAQYKDDALLKKVLYLANSRRVKFYIKQIPEYVKFSERTIYTNSIENLSSAIPFLEALSRREWTGHDAINELRGWLSDVPEDDAYIIERIIEKDCKIGMGTTNMNKIFPKLIEKTPYMGAQAYESKLVNALFSKADAVVRSDVKMDGRYANALIRSNEVELESRQGEPTIVTGAKFLGELTQFSDCVLNGELTMDGVPRYASNGIISSIIDIQSKREVRTPAETAKKIANFEKKHMPFQEALDKIRFTVWDTITIDEYFDNKSNRTCRERFRELIILLERYRPTMVSLVEHRFVNSAEEANYHFQELLNKGLEGTILKSLEGTWKDGKPNWQIKYKLEMDIDLEITGFNYGTGKNSELISSLNAKTSDGKLFTRPTGIDEETMKFITENQESLLGKIVEVKCSGLSHDIDGNYALLHPVFKFIRDDKDVANSLQEVEEIENAIKGLS